MMRKGGKSTRGSFISPFTVSSCKFLGRTEIKGGDRIPLWVRRVREEGKEVMGWENLVPRERWMREGGK